MERDHYQVLGVARGASGPEIRARYVQLVKLHHPDTAGSLSARLADVQAAYRCLADPATRAAHDRGIADQERAHLERQKRIRRRLGNYDRHHLTVAWRPRGRSRRWRTILVAAIGIGIVARAALELM